ITAKNGLQGAELSLNNTAAEARNVSVIFAVYAGESRVLKDMIFTETTIPAGETKVISQGLTFNDENSGGIVKVFVWDGTASMRPWLRGTQLEIR
ncbi:MAG: hypothetical protein SOZ34_05530, partial [Clostridia bacterium]|nr:hypothetical protein [Clostridia bacterium]